MDEKLTVHHSEPEDYEAVHRVYSRPRVMADTIGLPFSSKERWQERLAQKREGEFSLVACVGSEMVGHLSVYLYPEPRRRHSGHFGMAVRDDWQGKGIGTKLMEAALDLVDNCERSAQLHNHCYNAAVSRACVSRTRGRLRITMRAARYA
jgi:L-phenylalanine/L-methionine N-acetyltransferase